jgi:xylulokinase
MWPQIFADVTGHPVKIIKDDVEAPLGDALLAGLGTGVFEDPHIIKEWLEFKETIQPNHQNTEVYDQYYDQYKKVYLNLKENMQELSNINNR